MIGMVLVTHGRLAHELRLAMEHVVGPQQNVETVCIGAEDDIERCRSDIQAGIQHVDQGDGVVVLTDMFGGTPSNLAISVLDRANVEVIAGINLPMLIRLAKARISMGLREAAEAARDAVKAAAVEETASKSRNDATDAGLVADRERALLEEAVAQSGRLRAQLESGPKDKETPARTSAQANSDAGAKPAPKPSSQPATKSGSPKQDGAVKLDGGAP